LSERSIDLTTIERSFEHDFERGFKRRTLLRGLSQSSSFSDRTFVSNARFAVRFTMSDNTYQSTDYPSD